MAGLNDDARRIHQLMHKSAWTIDSELLREMLGELHLCREEILASSRHPKAIPADLKGLVRVINRRLRGYW